MNYHFEVVAELEFISGKLRSWAEDLNASMFAVEFFNGGLYGSWKFDLVLLFWLSPCLSLRDIGILQRRCGHNFCG